jgi:hypothetical protein
MPACYIRGRNHSRQWLRILNSTAQPYFSASAPLTHARAKKMVRRITALAKALTLFTYELAGMASHTSMGSTLLLSATYWTKMLQDSTPQFISTRRPTRPAGGAYRNFAIHERFLRNVSLASQIRFVPVVFSESADKTTYTVSIPGILDERTILHRDASGKPLSNETAMDAWSNTEHYADNALFKYHDPELHRQWDHSGAYANIKYFNLTKTMYDRKGMLGQFGDFSGHWTPEQLVIIQKQGLKE